MNEHPTIYADFHNADPKGRLRLNTTGTIADLSRLSIALADGLMVNVSDDELLAEGRVVYSTEEQVWVAEIDWNAIREIGTPVPQPSAA